MHSHIKLTQICQIRQIPTLVFQCMPECLIYYIFLCIYDQHLFLTTAFVERAENPGSTNIFLSESRTGFGLRSQIL